MQQSGKSTRLAGRVLSDPHSCVFNLSFMHRENLMKSVSSRHETIKTRIPMQAAHTARLPRASRFGVRIPRVPCVCGVRTFCQCLVLQGFPPESKDTRCRNDWRFQIVCSSCMNVCVIATCDGLAPPRPGCPPSPLG